MVGVISRQRILEVLRVEGNGWGIQAAMRTRFSEVSGAAGIAGHRLPETHIA